MENINEKIEFTKDEINLLKRVLKEKNEELRKLIYEDFYSNNSEHYYMMLESLKDYKQDVLNLLSKFD